MNIKNNFWCQISQMMSASNIYNLMKSCRPAMLVTKEFLPTCRCWCLCQWSVCWYTTKPKYEARTCCHQWQNIETNQMSVNYQHIQHMWLHSRRKTSSSTIVDPRYIFPSFILILTFIHSRLIRKLGLDLSKPLFLTIFPFCTVCKNKCEAAILKINFIHGDEHVPLWMVKVRRTRATGILVPTIQDDLLGTGLNTLILLRSRFVVLFDDYSSLFTHNYFNFNTSILISTFSQFNLKKGIENFQYSESN